MKIAIGWGIRLAREQFDKNGLQQERLKERKLHKSKWAEMEKGSFRLESD